MNAANIFMATFGFQDDPARTGILKVVATTEMKTAHTGDGGVVAHDMAPAFHPLVIPRWRDCLTCRICGYVLVTQRMYEQAPHWLKVYLAALYLEDWLMLIPETPEAADDAGHAD